VCLSTLHLLAIKLFSTFKYISPLKPESQSTFLSNAPRLPNELYFMEGSPASSISPATSSKKIKMSMEHWWHDIDRENPKYWRKTCPSAISSTKNLTRTYLESI
jgi:hypothetical protein